MIGHASVAAVGRAQLERPQEVVGALEVGADGVNLVDQILDGLEADVADAFLNNSIVGEGDALSTGGLN